MKIIIDFIVFTLICSPFAYLATEIFYAFLGAWAVKESKGEISKKEIRRNKILFAIALSIVVVAGFIS